MNRRDVLTMAPLVFVPVAAQSLMAQPSNQGLVISDFALGNDSSEVPGEWRGYTDRVMGGVSVGDANTDIIDDVRCLRLNGRVSLDNGGGFVQMARYLGTSRDGFDASEYRGIELVVRGNGEQYNVHLRTRDVGWHDQSYRATFIAEPSWQTIRLPWDAVAPNNIEMALDTKHLQRIGLLGWMREFDVDVALARASFYS